MQFVVFIIEYGKCILLVALGVIFQACEAVFVQRSVVQKCVGVGVVWVWWPRAGDEQGRQGWSR